jgi:Photosynthesis system II assembly factor YCF48
MNMKSASGTVMLLLLLCVLMISGATSARAQEWLPGWQAYDLPFRPLNITSAGQQLWVCGTDEGIAVSSDDGAHWQVKHQRADSGLLLNIDFADSKFGYAAGSGGLFFTTVDGGETWSTSSLAINETILQASFADAQHGLVRTPASLAFTVDGGMHWSAVADNHNLEIVKQFPYTFSLVALNSSHMAVLLKHGAAQYEPGALLFTQNSGKSWNLANIQSVTLYSFLRVGGDYWAVGTEVIHKDQPGGGYSVPVALYSDDGETWTHSNGDLSSCKPQMCSVCNTQGCLSSNGVISRIFLQRTSYSAFASNSEMTSKWGATDSRICFVGAHLNCGPLKNLSEIPSAGGSPIPTVLSPNPLGVPIPQGPQCIACGLERNFIDSKANGVSTVTLILVVAKNGTVASIETQGAPTPVIKSRIEQEAQQWIFEPYMKDGRSVNVRFSISVKVNVIKPR